MRYCSTCGQPGHHARAGRRLAPACLLRPVRHDSLRQPAPGGRHDPGVGPRGAAVPPRDRAALRQVDAAGRLHGDRRNDRRRRAARDARGGRRTGRARPAVLDDRRAARRAGAHLLPRAAARSRSFVPGDESLEVQLFQEAAGAVGGDRVSHRRGHAASLLRRPRAAAASACTPKRSTPARQRPRASAA